MVTKLPKNIQHKEVNATLANKKYNKKAEMDPLTYQKETEKRGMPAGESQWMYDN
jgi:hypothetical protein